MAKEIAPLNTAECKVLVAIGKAIIAETGNEFTFGDRIHQHVPKSIDRRALPGYCASLRRKGLFTSTLDWRRQIQFTADGARAYRALTGSRKRFETV